MRVELITTGTELLLGRTLNTHVRFLAEGLFPLGLRLARQVSVPDGPVIAAALREGMERSDLLLVTGGLGPTSDDVTREVAAGLLGRELEWHEPAAARIREFYAARGRPFDEGARRQAMIPGGGEALPNPHGTAPGIYLPAGDGNPHLFLLPGPPRELYPMFRQEVVPRLEAILGGKPEVECREWSFAGLGESELARLIEPELRCIEGLEIGYCAGSAAVHLRVIASPPLLEAAGRRIRHLCPEAVISADGSSLEEVVVRLLRERGAWVSAAESCTGGMIANRLTNVPGASEVLGESYVTYANAAKERLLGVPGDLLARHGAVSPEVAGAMAEGCLRVSGADYALAATGIAGPGGGSPEKPVGLVYLGLAGRGSPTHVERCHFPVDRETFKLRASQKALDLLRRALLGFAL